jgi:phosphotriesterase-related protein
MALVETVRGPIDSAELGTTLMHEHVFILDLDYYVNDPERMDDDALIATAIAQLRDVGTRGVRSVVDLTVLGLGRDVRRVQRVADQVDVHIVAATGIYTYDEVPFAFRYRFPGTGRDGGDPMTDLFVRDITEGIAGTSVKAGILKCATDERGLTPGVERVLRAVAKAHRATGVPISTHTDSHHHRGRDQQRVFAEEGVDLTRVVIGHCGDTTELDYLKELMDKGSTIGMDRFGVDVLCPFEDRVATVAALCEQGYADRMVLSHDAGCHMNWFPPTIKEFAPRWILTHISDDVLPALRERGVTDAQLEQMLVQNPRRVFEQQGAY